MQKRLNGKSQIITEANTQDRLGCAIALLEEVGEGETIELIWVDAGFSGEKFANVVDTICGAKVEVVKRNSCDFEILP